MNMAIKDYHNHKAISNSDLSLINKSIEHYLRKSEREDTSATDLGQAFHDMILSPEIFEKNYSLMPKEIKIKKGKAWDEYKNIVGDKIILSREEEKKLEGMRESFYKHPKAPLLLTNGKAEKSFFFEQAGIECKCRPDFVNEKYGLIVDLKTTQSVLPDDFARSIANYRYHVQASWYLDGVNRCLLKEYDKFLFIAVETKSPYSVCIYDLGNESIEEGRKQYKKDLNKYIEYLANKDNKDFYSGVSADIITLQLPNWAFYKNIELE